MSRCDICDHSCKLVQPTGPRNADILFIAEKPGVTEDKFGRVMCGDTGKELDQTYLPLAGLDRHDVRVVNSVYCRLGGSNTKPTPAQIDGCARHHLPSEVAECQPSVIVLLGSTACSLVPEIELDKAHGMPVYFDGGSSNHPYFGVWSGWLFPCFHPAAALHSTSMMIPLLDDFQRLGQWLNGKWIAPTSNIETNYSLLTTIFDLDAAFDDDIKYEFVPLDSESDGKSPWSIQFSLRPGHGAMILANNHTLLRRFARLIGNRGFLLHHATADLGVLEELGIPMAGRPMRDTMIELYELGNQPQALKSAAYRLLGTRMRSWADLTAGPSRQKMIAWLVDKWIEEGENKLRVEVQLKRSTKIVLKPNPMERTLKRLLSHSHKEGYDLWSKVAEAGITGAPIQSIVHTELSDAVSYSCADADMTGRVASWLEVERRRITQEEWQVDSKDKDV